MKTKKIFLSIVGFMSILILLVLVIGLPREDMPSAQTLSVATSADNLNRMSAPTFLLTISDSDADILISEALNEARKNGRLPLDISDEKFTLIQQGLKIKAHVTGKLPEKETVISGDVNGGVAVSIEGTNIVLRPVFQQITLTEINGVSVSWIPDIAMRFLKRVFLSGVNTAVKTALNQINIHIDPTIQPIDIHPLGTENKPGEPIKFSLGDREFEIPAPILAATALLIDDNGIQVMGQLLEPDSKLSKSSIQSTDNFQQYQKQFRETAVRIFNRSSDSFGKSGISLSETFFLNYFSLLSEGSIANNQRNTVIQASKALSRIAAPTFLTTISSEDVSKLLDKHLKNVLSGADLPVTFEGVPQIKLSDQGVNITSLIGYTLEKYKSTIFGKIKGTVNVSVDGVDIVLTPGFQSITIEKIDGIDLSALPLDAPDDLLSDVIIATNIILNAGLPQINAQIGTIKQSIDIQPIGTLDQPGTPISFSVGETDYSLPAPVLASSALLIDTAGIHVMGQLIKQGETAPESNLSETEDFSEYKKRFTAKAVEGLKVKSSVFQKTGVTLSEDFLRDYLNVLPSISAEERRREAILKTEQSFNALKGPDIGISLSSSELGPVNTTCPVNNFLLLLAYENNTGAIRKNSRHFSASERKCHN